MTADYSRPPFSPVPKGRVKALDQADQRKALEAEDKRENAKVKKRAGGRCEVIVSTPNSWAPNRSVSLSRCERPGIDPHHLISGSGRRNRGKSILADYKLWVCRQCHDDITRKILKPTTAEHDAGTVRYVRAK